MGETMFSTFRTTAIAAAALALAQLASPAQAAYIVSLQQVGANVVATGSGSIDITDLSIIPNTFAVAPVISPTIGVLYLSVGNGDLYSSISGPSEFGSGGFNNSASGSGNVAGIDFLDRSVIVPEGYVSGDALSSSLTWDNATLTSLGVTPGTYKWTWGSGAHADSFMLQIGPVAPVPEPASLTLLAMGLAGLGMVLRTRRA
jgi:hypothetical protein